MNRNIMLKIVILKDIYISSVKNLAMYSLNVGNKNHIPILLHPRQDLQQHGEIES